MTTAVKGGAARASRSGWTDADYEAAGFGRLSLRLPEETLRRLEAVRDWDGGTGRAEWIGMAIDAAWGKMQRDRERIDKPCDECGRPGCSGFGCEP